MFNEIMLIINTYYFINLSEYILHKAAHNHKYGGIIYEWHRKHHIIEFPLKHLTRNEYPKNDTEISKYIYLFHFNLVDFYVLYS